MVTPKHPRRERARLDWRRQAAGWLSVGKSREDHPWRTGEGLENIPPRFRAVEMTDLRVAKV